MSEYQRANLLRDYAIKAMEQNPRIGVWSPWIAHGGDAFVATASITEGNKNITERHIVICANGRVDRIDSEDYPITLLRNYTINTMEQNPRIEAWSPWIAHGDNKFVATAFFTEGDENIGERHMVVYANGRVDRIE